jgi:hypothetical protein
MEDEELTQIMKGVADRLAGADGRPGLPQAADALAGRLNRIDESTRDAATSFERTEAAGAEQIEQSVPRPVAGSEARTDTAVGGAADPQPGGPGTAPHPLRGLWLERKVQADTSIDPFTSIMDLPDDEAARIAYAMGKRFDGDYVAYRREIESWLRSKAAEKGNPSGAGPLYFKLVSEQATYPAREGSAVIRIPADSIPVEHLTFTVDDSFYHYLTLRGVSGQGAPEGLVPHVISGVDAGTALDFEGRHRDFLFAVDGSRYIEAQIWSRDDPILAEARRQFQAGIPADRTITVHPAPASDGGGIATSTPADEPAG